MEKYTQAEHDAYVKAWDDSPMGEAFACAHREWQLMGKPSSDEPKQTDYFFTPGIVDKPVLKRDKDGNIILTDEDIRNIEGRDNGY